MLWKNDFSTTWSRRFAWLPTALADGTSTWLGTYEQRYVPGAPADVPASLHVRGWWERRLVPRPAVCECYRTLYDCDEGSGCRLLGRFKKQPEPVEGSFRWATAAAVEHRQAFTVANLASAELIRAIGLALNASHGTVTTDAPDAVPDDASWRVDHAQELLMMDELARRLVSTDTAHGCSSRSSDPLSPPPESC